MALPTTYSLTAYDGVIRVQIDGVEASAIIVMGDEERLRLVENDVWEAACTAVNNPESTAKNLHAHVQHSPSPPPMPGAWIRSPNVDFSDLATDAVEDAPPAVSFAEPFSFAD